jgi:hypothetical protein
MLVCPQCSHPSPAAPPAGVDECSSCGAVRVWPQLESPEHAAITDADLQAQLRRAVLRHGVLPWTVSMLVAGRDDRRRIYARACWTVERRMATLRIQAAAPSGQQKTAELPDPDAPDIWANDPETIRRQTQCVCRCPPCRGTGEMDCPQCGGSNRMICRACHGRGHLQREDRVIVRGSNSTDQTATVSRTEQCLPCRGTGNVECDACRNGKVECSQCEGFKRVEAWIEVSVERMAQVRVAADFNVEAMHAAVADCDDFATPAERLPAELIADTGLHPPDALPGCPASLQVVFDARTDRVRAVRVQQLCTRVVRLNLATRLQREVVEFAGRPARLVSGSIRALAQRAWLSLGAGLGAMVLGFAAVAWYVGRSPWFAVHGRAGTLAGLVAVAGGLVAALVLGITLPNLRRSMLRWMAPLIGLLLTIALLVEVWRSAAPSSVGVRAAIERGDLDDAEQELEALVKLERDAGVAELRAELTAARGQQADRERLARLHDTDGFEQAGEILHERWHDPSLRDEQLAEHVGRARIAIDEAWANAEAESLDALAVDVSELDATLAAEATTLAKLLAIRATIGREEFEAAGTELAAIRKSDATADQRSTVELELREAIATTARKHYALGLDESRPDADRVASLGEFESLAALHETITGELPSEVDRAHATAIAAKLKKAIDRKTKRKLE